MSPKTMVMMTSPIAMACSRPVPAMTMATGEASTMRAAVAKALMRPTIHTHGEVTDDRRGVLFGSVFGQGGEQRRGQGHGDERVGEHEHEVGVRVRGIRGVSVPGNRGA